MNEEKNTRARQRTGKETDKESDTDREEGHLQGGKTCIHRVKGTGMNRDNIREKVRQIYCVSKKSCQIFVSFPNKNGQD